MTDPARPRAGHAALRLAGVTKRFGSVTAVDAASLTAFSGSVHAVLGENGAGKSTLMRVAFGLLRPDAGSIEVDGVPRAFRSPGDAIAAGLGMVHQHFTNVPAMTVAENVALGGHGRFTTAGAARTLEALGERTGLRLDPSARVGDLSVGAQQRLEILKALAHSARILILDEPTAVLAPAEADDLLRWLRSFADAGNAVVMITHKLREALRIADSVTVMRRGRVVLDAPADTLDAEALAQAVVGGAAPSGAGAPAACEAGHVVARLNGVSVADENEIVRVRDAHLAVRSGEILGIAAVEGSGHRELIRALASRVAVGAGEAELPEEVGYIPEDRHADALILDFSQTENVVLRNAGERRGVIDWPREEENTRALSQAFDVRGANPEAAARSLSGGNQQKLVLGRELSGRPTLIVAENPTRGLDIKASADVFDSLRAAASVGAAVVLYSSDLDEVLSLATRMVVVHAGSVREVPMDREVVGRAMLGVAE